MTILFAASEVAPLASTGGLGDVIASLPTFISSLGHNVAVALPGYPALLKGAEPLGVEYSIQLGDASHPVTIYERLSPNGAQWLLIQNETFFNRNGIYGDKNGPYSDNAARYIFFSKAVIELARRLDPAPDVLHLHDWHTALIPMLVQDQNLPLKTLLTLHNVQHQGAFWALDFPLTGLSDRWFRADGLEFYGQINLLKGGILAADALTTISTTYRQNILTSNEGCGLNDVLKSRQNNLFSIPNGVDPDLWNPESKSDVPTPFSTEHPEGKAACQKALLRELNLAPNPKAPVFAMIGRLSEEKGFDVLLPLLPRLFATDARLIIQGDGDASLRRDLLAAVRQHPSKMAFCNRWNPAFTKHVLAGADFLLVPSHNDPSSLTPLHALRYGAIPVAHGTSGLLEQLTDYDVASKHGNALIYRADSSAALWDAIQRAMWMADHKQEHSQLLQNAMRTSFPWENSAAHFDALYRRLAGEA